MCKVTATSYIECPHCYSRLELDLRQRIDHQIRKKIDNGASNRVDKKTTDDEIKQLRKTEREGIARLRFWCGIDRKEEGKEKAKRHEGSHGSGRSK
ncbi:uncharacterized protein KY384_003841 [Bacidia gigantensis]|uniref:uncharacterized protein n=1 Tax=Bacidia gigantensis TaxID=2732470 RepID=UPI001D0444D8|nr:uncharacterized protein KY384_003841 [Bacidia gigantensis]KAG8532200.1 hypothetical protein KY384_003841 [Bacidia gigantensis]